MAITVNLAADLKNYIDVYRESISTEILYGPEEMFVNEFFTVETEAEEGEIVALPTFRMTEVTQPYQVAYTPKGTPTFGGNKVTMRRLKIDHSIIPDQILASWVSKLRQAGYDEARARKEMPITRFIMDEMLRQQAEEREDSIIFTGVYAAPTPGTAGAASTSVDGLHEYLKDAITAGTLVPKALGSFTTSDIFEYFEEFFSEIPSKFFRRPLLMYVAPEHYLSYGRDKRANFQFQQQMQQLLGIDFSMLTIKPVHAMAGSNRLIITVPNNLARMVGKVGPGQNMDVQPYERTVKVLTDWREAYGVRDLEYIWVNDQV